MTGPGRLPAECFKDNSLFAQYQCVYCKHLLKDAVQLTCGDRLCEKCAVELLKTKPSKCPNKDCEGSEIDPADKPQLQYHADKFARGVVERLELYCPHKCGWEGRLGQLQAHSCKDFLKKTITPRRRASSLGSALCPIDFNITTTASQPTAAIDINHGRHTMYVASSLPTTGFPATSPVARGYHVVPTASLLDRVEQTEHDVSEIQLLMEHHRYSDGYTWEIPDIKRNKTKAQSDRTEYLDSPPFYTSPPGYRMCLRLYLNGTDFTWGSHLSLFFVLMNGKFDAFLSWPFKKKVTFTMFKGGGEYYEKTFVPNPESISLRRPAGGSYRRDGFPQFLPVQEFQNGGYILDDKVLIKCKVD